MMKNPLSFSCGRYELGLGKKTHIMGVLNLTPDSFYDGGKCPSLSDALERAERMLEEGADIIDVGGESTRPGAEPLSAGEEMERILPVLREMGRRFSIPISVDTYKVETARAALAEGASIVNDVGGLHRDPSMAGTVAEYRAGVVVMHMRGDPRTMQDAPQYDHVMEEIKTYLSEGIEKGIEAGIGENSFLVDPGIGFGKTFFHNVEILKNLSFLLDLNKPILVGLSRKSFLGHLSGLPVENRLEGSLAASVIAVLNGANILRTHDVKETKRAVEVADLFKERLS